MPETSSSLRSGVGRPRAVVLAALLALLLCTAVPSAALAAPAQPTADAWARLTAWIDALWGTAPGSPDGSGHVHGASFGGTGGGDTGLGLDPDGTDPDPTPTGNTDPPPTATGLTTGFTTTGPAVTPSPRVRGRI